MIDQSIACRAMGGAERLDAFTLMQHFRSDERRLGAALALFTEREDYGFVWLAYREDELVGCCSVAYAIATAGGGLAAIVRDVYVTPQARRTGVATAMLAALAARLAALSIERTEIPADGPDGAAFLVARGFVPTGERLFSADR